MAPKADSSRELDEHLERVRLVNSGFQIPLIDVWDPKIAHQLTDLTEKNGRITGTIDDYRLQYYEGDDLPVEVNILARDTGRRIAQDGSRDSNILTSLRARIASE